MENVCRGGPPGHKTFTQNQTLASNKLLGDKAPIHIREELPIELYDADNMCKEEFPGILATKEIPRIGNNLKRCYHLITLF
ncbi:hypothetical protein SK128_005272 [Halocaridina rubra]|uniref:Uncharacterized protein n=1 Tax=Halocaridina rubra TaxID=373956 RepID=A0AAN8WZR4_HALRR